MTELKLVLLYKVSERALILNTGGLLTDRVVQITFHLQWGARLSSGTN